MCPHFARRQPTALPFGASLSASLARCVSRCFQQFTCVGPVLQPGSPTSLDAGSRETSSRLPPRPIGRSSVVTAASHTTVASRAGAARLLRTEPQVRLMVLSISNDYLSDFHVARRGKRRVGRGGREPRRDFRIRQSSELTCLRPRSVEGQDVFCASYVVMVWAPLLRVGSVINWTLADDVPPNK